MGENVKLKERMGQNAKKKSGKVGRNKIKHGLLIREMNRRERRSKFKPVYLSSFVGAFGVLEFVHVLSIEPFHLTFCLVFPPPEGGVFFFFQPN